MIEKGSDITARACPMLESSVPCVQCSLCSILCGWGGAGAYSDGKLTLTPEFGGWLKEYISPDDLSAFIDHVDAIVSIVRGRRSDAWAGRGGPWQAQEKSGRL